MTAVDVTWTDPSGMSMQTSVEVTDGDPGKPLAVLVHGNGGNANHMIAPAISPGLNYDYKAPFAADRDEGWHGYPGMAAWSFQLDPVRPVSGLQPVLAARGYGTASYSQIDNTGLLARPVIEFAAIVAALLRRYPDRPLAFVAHSRGGLLVRRFLKDHTDDADLHKCLRCVVTLHSPHQGTTLATVASGLAGAIAATMAAHPTYAPLVASLLETVGEPAYQEMAEGSPFLADLAAGELPWPGVRYHTFGGTNVNYGRLLWWVFALDSLIPQWHWPPFHWRIFEAELPIDSPMLGALPGLCPEITSGLGDGLVADERARLTYAAHTTRALNHAEVLWDDATQADVTDLVGGQNAQYRSESVPLAFSVSQTAAVTITFRNTGAMAWTAAEGYRLGSQSPANNTTWGPGRVELPRASVAPGEEVTFAFPVTAPATPGTRSFQWRMQQEGVEWFGDASPSMEITVADAGEDPQCPNLRAQILQLRGEIADLQADLAAAAPGAKPGLTSAIRRSQATLAATHTRAESLHCPAIP